MIKRILYLVLFLVAGVALAGAPLSMDLGTNAVTVLPERSVSRATTWVSGMTVAQGQMVRNNSRFYMAEAAATSTNAPAHVSGSVSGFRLVSKGPRAGFVLQNDSSVNMWLAFGETAEEDKGLLLVPTATLTLFGYQGRVSAVAASGTGNRILITEIPGR